MTRKKNDKRIREHADGTFSFRIDAGVHPRTGKRRQVHRRGFKSITAAEKGMQAVIAELITTGDYIEPSSQPLRVYLEHWLTAIEVNRKPSTASMYRHKLERYVMPRIGDQPMRAIDPATLDALYAGLMKNGGKGGKALSEQTVSVTHRILHKALADAVKRRIIRSNPATDAEVPRSTAPRERDAWSSDELRAFLAHIDADRLRALWLLAASTGLRRGELCGLEWSDVDLDKQKLRVQRSRVPVRHKGVVESTPKTYAGMRVVSLAPATVAALRAHHKAQLEERMANADVWQETGYVFVKENGQPLYPDAMTEAFNDLVTEAGIRRIVFYGLRHSHITLGLAAGVPLKVMQERAGHAKIETTLSYAHALAGMQEQAAATFEETVLGL